ncbi:MAG: VCBS repeat-containing protein [Planctomycetota bacterium]|nr:VCBS repeat-containing protein [Planctomycetota bacterium]
MTRLLSAVFFFWCGFSGAEEGAWLRHTIDKTSRGADGVRFLDVNGDGLEDIATGWEEGALIRAYLHPGPKKVTAPWPLVTVGRVKSPEDAVFCDLDGDGAVDVVSCCEGGNRRVFAHWAPRAAGRFLDEKAWETTSFPAVEKKTQWMFALPMELDGKGGIDLVLGAKGRGACVGWLRSPANPRDPGAWTFHSWYQAGWIMSLISEDIDGDGDSDVVISDRRGKTPGVLWLENPGRKALAETPGLPWREHRLGVTGKEVFFVSLYDLDGDGRKELAATVRPNQVILLSAGNDPRKPWREELLEFSLERFGTAKAVRPGDLDGDGVAELAISCENASGGKSGVFYLRRAGKKWVPHELSGPSGVKFDRIELRDLDGDGDLDLITCEESDNLGVFWYENPASKPATK